MTGARLFPLLGALALAAACEAKIDRDEAGDAQGEITAEGKAEENKVTIKAPGVDIQVDIPEGIRAGADVESDSDLIYPGSRLGGVHIEAGSNDQGAVEIRFSSADATDKVAAWYRDAARTGFKIDSETREGPSFVFNGRETDDNSRFKLRVGPRAGGGTDGTLSVQE